MIKILTMMMLALALSATAAFAHDAFKLVSSEKKTITEAELATLEKGRTVATKDGKGALTFTGKEIRIVATTGPEDDMLSYRIDGLRNPNLVVPSGAILRILFVNADEDMRHDIRFGHVPGTGFEVMVDKKETAGSETVNPKSADGKYQAEEFVIEAAADGAFKYFCSVRGHAKGGMWGNILVGAAAAAAAATTDLVTPEKKPHVHSADEDGMDMDGGGGKEMPGMKMDDKKKPSEKSMAADMPGMNMPGMKMGGGGQTSGMMTMPSVTDLNNPMTSESSGTSWVPDSTPMYARTKMFGDGSMLMWHGNMFFRYASVGSTRDVSVAGKGDRQRFDAPSMFMVMYSKPIGRRSQLGFRAMLSLDPAIERGYGYPLLYQSGESFRGRPIHDRQHPHDLFSELSVSYSYRIGENQSFYLYAGYPGEPALGPPTFMHRLSAMNNPDAPLGHHWQDSTHVTFGVLTAGYNFGKFKFEASAFKGREPDENRWNFDTPKLDSYSARFTFNPTREWSFQISHGYLRNPEPSEPELRILRRTTASAIFNRKLTESRNLAASVVWGQNYGNGERTNAFLGEVNYSFGGNSVFGRAESVQKSGHELVLDEADQARIFRVGSYSAGYLREIYKDKNWNVGLGAQATLYRNPAGLVTYYGGTSHGGWQIFMRIRPAAIN